MADTARRSHARRSSPRLRTKTGCLTCRERRKKCDEEKPRCEACRRNWIMCRWPPVRSSPARSRSPPKPSSGHEILNRGDVRTAASSLPPLLEPTHRRNDSVSLDVACYGIASPLNSRPPGLRGSRDQSLLLHLVTELGPFLVRAHSHQAFFDHSYMVNIALHVPAVMDAFLALSSMHLSAQQDESYPVAIEYYSSAVRGLRNMLNTQAMNGTEDWLLIMMNILCLFERWNPNPCTKPTTHLAAVIQVFRVRLAKRAGATSRRQISTFERSIAESVLYQSVVLSLYREMDDVVIGDLFDRLEEMYLCDPFPDAPSWANSPLLGLSPALYRRILEVFRLSRRVPLNETDHGVAFALMEGLSDPNLTWDYLLQSDENKDFERIKRISCHGSTRLFLLAAQVMLFKVIYPDTPAQHPRIQNIVQQAISLLIRHDSLSLRYDQYLILPLVVLRCAMIRDEDTTVVWTALERVWKNTLCGDAKRGLAVLDECRKNRQSGSESGGQCEIYGSSLPSGFDILVRRVGIFNELCP